MSGELVKRTKQFAIRVIKLVQSLPDHDKVAEVLGRQILRSGTSVGANYRSALRGRSDKDFLSRLAIAEEEADETVYWLELLIEAGIVSEKKLRLLLQEARELTAILTASGKTQKAKMKITR
jgi:four helix bundle protein